MKLDETTYRLSGTEKVAKGLLIGGVLFLVISLIGLLKPQPQQFYFSLLTSWIFWMTIGFGGLFFVMLHHLVGATWSIVLRRIVETVMVVLPVMFVFALLIVLPFTGLQQLYEWAREIASGQSLTHLLEVKSGWWLNGPFFMLRTLFYFAILFLLTRILYRTSLKQDAGHTDRISSVLKLTSGPGMVLFALVITFSSFDWIMSLDYKWYSTIFGVYVFSGSVVAILSFTTLVALFLRSRGFLKESITVEHYHDLGKLIFAFLVFWAYIAFSQFFLIWYGNIPEETDFYIKRFAGNWGTMGVVILFGHFFLPFFLLLSRVPKRNPRILGIMAVWMLFMHWIDLHWLIMPNLHEQLALSWLDLTTFLGVGGIFLWLFLSRLSSQPLIPVKDPQLQDSVQFTNT